MTARLTDAEREALDAACIADWKHGWAGSHPDRKDTIAAVERILGDREVALREELGRAHATTNHEHELRLAAEAQVQRVRELADRWEEYEAYLCSNASECVRCVSFQRAVIQLRAALDGGADR